MHNYLPEFLTVAALHLLAVMSPGPDFVLVSKNSLVYSRKSGILSAVGLALGILVHVTYSLVGIAYIISKSIVLFSILKFLGAGYLIYIGYKSLKAKPKSELNLEPSADKIIDGRHAIKTGFLTNVLNPKVSLFFFAVFTQVIHATTPLGIKVLYGLEMSTMTFMWFALVAIILSHHYVKKPFVKIQHYVERVMGGLLILLGLKVLISKSK
jgi:RhtB (resistance to homoserine/threonine) family protein